MTMSMRPILLTGTRGAGKSTACNALERAGLASQLRAVTTRPPRQDDSPSAYQYTSEDDFDVLLRRDDLLVDALYAGYRYGFRRDALVGALTEKLRPILTVTPSSAARLLKVAQYDWICFFLDAPDEILDERLRASQRPATSSDRVQRDIDREAYAYGMLRVATDMELKDLISHLRSLMGVL